MREGTQPENWQGVPFYRWPVCTSMSIVDLANLKNTGGAIIAPALPSPVVLVAGSDITMAGEVTLNGEGLQGTWKAGETIMALETVDHLVEAPEAKLACLKGYLVFAHEVTGEFTTGPVPPGNGNLGCGPAPTRCQSIKKLIHFAFIDESSPYAADPALHAADTAKFNTEIRRFPQRYVVLFQVGPYFDGGEYGAVRPVPPSVIYRQCAVQDRPAKPIELLPTLEDALRHLGIGPNTEFHLSFSIDNSGSMTAADVQTAVDAVIARVAAYPKMCVASTYGAGDERWINNMLVAIEEIENPLP
jgi:hypothetical protein